MPSPKDLPNPGIEPGYRTLQMDFLPTELSGKPSLCIHSILFNTKQVSVFVRVCTHMLSHVWLFPTPWTLSCQAPLSVESPRQQYWSRLPFPPLRDLPHPMIETVSCDSCVGRQILYQLHHSRIPGFPEKPLCTPNHLERWIFILSKKKTQTNKNKHTI